MQLHGPTEPIDTIPVVRYGTSGGTALQLPAGVWLVLDSIADADRLIIAATQAKDILAERKAAASAAEVADGAEPEHESDCDCASWPQEPHPVEPVPHLPQHTHGNPVCNLCGIDHDAQVRIPPPAWIGYIRPLPGYLAPPAGYQLPSASIPADGAR